MFATKLIQANELDRWLSSLLDGLAIPSDQRCRISAACFLVALDHHRGIVLLLEHAVYPPASALLRSLAEAYLRGCWLAFCCSETELDQFTKGDTAPSTEGIVRVLEKHPAFATGVLRDVKDRTWATMCDFTHTGIRQIIRNLKDGEVATAYDESELTEMLAAANSWALLAGHTLAGVAGDTDLAARLNRKATESISE